jgi:mannobiose 2-epimerase
MTTPNDISVLRKEWQDSLQQILRYWHQYTPDQVHGGFQGGVNNLNEPIPDAAKGSVLHARILWTFSKAMGMVQEDYLPEMAGRAYRYIVSDFMDTLHGGVYWSLKPKGGLLDGRKQIYAQAFTIYGMSAYYAATGLQDSLDHAIRLFHLIEQHSADPAEEGYFEAFSRDWGPLEDLRLSVKDANEKKTANTHLHILEAYAELYKVWPDPVLRERIIQLLNLFHQYFIDPQSGHLKLFFDEHWREKLDAISYGHDIEAAWLLHQCAEVSEDESLMDVFQGHAIRTAYAAVRGLNADGGLWYEFHPQSGTLIREKHWWPQAEAMLGFYHAWQITGEPHWLEKSVGSWSFVKNHILDKQHGEWYWGVTENNLVMPGQDKAGFWKCPYHNGRALMELLERTGHNAQS